MASIQKNLRDSKTRQEISYQDEYTKVLGVKWNVVSDCFHPVISSFKVDTPLTKQILVLNIAYFFNNLQWCFSKVI